MNRQLKRFLDSISGPEPKVMVDPNQSWLCMTKSPDKITYSLLGAAARLAEPDFTSSKVLDKNRGFGDFITWADTKTKIAYYRYKDGVHSSFLPSELYDFYGVRTGFNADYLRKGEKTSIAVIYSSGKKFTLPKLVEIIRGEYA